MVAAIAALGVQYFVANPAGDQPDWLATLTLLSGLPAAYVIQPLRGPLDAVLPPPGSHRFLEVETAFGPAFRASRDEMMLIALGTVVMVGLVAYLASGLSEMVSERHR
jgi:hypothetical protein